MAGPRGIEPLTYGLRVHELSLFAKREPSLRENFDWAGFQEWQKSLNRPKVARDQISYARKYASCLFDRNFSEISTLSDSKRRHALAALAALAKFLGIHEDFKALVRNFGLHWTGKSVDDLIIERMVKVKDKAELYNWMKLVKSIVPDYAAFVDFVAATGLRYEEAVNAWNLIIELTHAGKLDQYYNREKQILEHFKFKEIFLRRTKKAFVSFVSEGLIDKIARQKRLTVNLLRLRVKRQGYRMRFGDVRELHATVSTRHLSQPEIDFLHGRVSTNVFMRNYFNPAWISDLQERTLKAAAEILAKIS
jgi:intergrase/recombinase